MKNNTFNLVSRSLDFSSSSFFSNTDRKNRTNPNSSPSKTQTFINSFLNYKSPTQKSISSSNRKNPLFYSISKPEKIPYPETFKEKDCRINRKEDEKFNEFKNNLLEELKVLKEANNMMRERNKFINKNNSNKFENRWITNFENKKQKEKNEMTPTINKTKTYINQIGTKPKLIDNYADKIPKYNTEKNIYSSKFKHSANDTCLGPSKNFKVSKDSDLLPEKINLINSSLNFDIKKFINDLAELANTRSPTDLTKKLDIKPYCLKDCKLQFIIPTTEVESLKIESLSQKLENEGDIDFKPSDNNKETISFCLNNIYDQVIKKVKKKESKKITFEKKELENLNEYNPTQLLIEDSLKNIYDIAIQQHMKKKTNKEHTIEKKVTKNYLDELYTNICKPKQEKIRNDVDFLDLNKIKQTKFDIYERLDKMVAGTFKNLHENLLWIYLKTKFKVQE